MCFALSIGIEKWVKSLDLQIFMGLELGDGEGPLVSTPPRPAMYMCASYKIMY